MLRIFTSLCIIILISENCLAVINRKSGKEVNEFGPVIKALKSCDHLNFESEYLQCPILDDYLFTFNEQYNIASIIIQSASSEYIPFRSALERAAIEDEYDVYKYNELERKILYKKTMAFFKVCQKFPHFNRIITFDAKLSKEIALANEFSKLPMFPFQVRDLITDPIGSKRRLVEIQDSFIDKIEDILRIDDRTNKMEALNMLIHINSMSSKSNLAESLSSIKINDHLKESILRVLVQHQIIDETIRNRAERDFYRETQFKSDQIDNLEFDLLNLSSLYGDILYIFDHSKLLEIEAIRKLQLWDSYSILDIYSIKQVLYYHDEDLKDTIISIHNRLILSIHALLESIHSPARLDLQRMDPKAIEDIYSKIHSGTFTENEIKIVLENYAII